MSRHTLTHEIEISFTPAGCIETECAYPEFEITFGFTPGRAAQTYGPAENCYPADPAEVEFISAKVIADDGLDLTAEQIADYAETWLMDDGYQAALDEVTADDERRMPE